MMTVSALIARTARNAGDRPALTWPRGRLTYRELLGRALRVANALDGVGCRPGDRMALLLDNHPSFVEAYLGAALAGVVVVPINPRLHLDELRAIIADAQPSVVLYDTARAEAVATLAEGVEPAGVASAPAGARRAIRPIAVPDAYETWLEQAREGTPPPRASDDTLAIAYTSGTTGRPKGVLIDQANAAASIMNGVTAFGLTAALRNVLFQPLVFHPLFVGHVLGPLAVGGVVHLLDRFDPDAYLDAVATTRATFLVHIPTTIRRVLEAQERRPRDLSSVQTLFTGGAPITSALLEEALRCFPRVVQGYGLTEATNIVAATSGDRPSGARDCGYALPFAELDVQDGEICVRGPVVMRAYWQRPDATAEVLRDGWLRTGDLGTLDAGGRLEVVGRIKETIISGGVKIHAAEVEECIARHPGVAEVAVAGVPDAEWGESVAAWVVGRPGATLTAEAVRKHCETHLARFKRPRHVWFLDALPRNANGKVQKDLLRQRHGEG